MPECMTNDPLPCRADQQPRLGGVPLPRHRPLATHAAATQPEGQLDVGEDRQDRQRLAPQTAHPSPLAAATLCRQTPEVGAVCGNAARTDLCGGCAVMRIPTAIQSRRKALIGSCRPKPAPSTTRCLTCLPPGIRPCPTTVSKLCPLLPQPEQPLTVS